MKLNGLTDKYIAYLAVLSKIEQIEFLLIQAYILGIQDQL
jgi:hypothetical protein